MEDPLILTLERLSEDVEGSQVSSGREPGETVRHGELELGQGRPTRDSGNEQCQAGDELLIAERENELRKRLCTSLSTTLMLALVFEFVASRLVASLIPAYIINHFVV